MRAKCASVPLVVAILVLSGPVLLSCYYQSPSDERAFTQLEEFGANLMVNENTADLRAFPAMTLVDGTIYVAWQEQRAGENDIFFSKSLNNGTTFSPPVIVNDEPVAGTAIQRTPDIAVLDDNVFVVWEDSRQGVHYIYLAVSTDDGNAFGSSVGVSYEGNPEKDWEPSVAVDRNSGIVHVAWKRGYPAKEIRAGRSLDNGLTFQPSVLVSDSSTRERHNPDIAVDNNGKVYVVWKDGRSGTVDVGGGQLDDDFDIMIANSTDQGLSFGQNVAFQGLLDVRQILPSIAIDGNDDVHVVWADERLEFNKYYIMYARSSDGASFSAGVLVNNSSPSVFGGIITRHLSPSIAVDPLGQNIWVVWVSNRGGNDNVYVARSDDGGQSFGPLNTRSGGNYYFDSNNDGIFNSGEAVIMDDGNDALDPGILNGTDSPDKVIVGGNASLVLAGD
ncbi:MAG: exo-alpha-sialidase, partial [Thermoplasmata archaeon]|nr:exo-alpha-sialidase [Thermoplasmata archaeon]